jgi:hypothetical protein
MARLPRVIALDAPHHVTFDIAMLEDVNHFSSSPISAPRVLVLSNLVSQPGFDVLNSSRLRFLRENRGHSPQILPVSLAPRPLKGGP